jgi:hypothetical protein
MGVPRFFIELLKKYKDTHFSDPDFKFEHLLMDYNAFIYPSVASFFKQTPYESFKKLTESKSFNVRILRFNNIVFAKLPSEGAQRILDFQTDTIVEKCEFPAHSVIVHTNQKNAKVIVHLLDPIAPSSMLRWGYFNAIFEQKEYAENYVMEDLVPKMLDNDPELKIEFEEFMSKHPEIKGNQWVTLNWFYQRTEYWDKQKDRYPIGMYFGE